MYRLKFTIEKVETKHTGKNRSFGRFIKKNLPTILAFAITVIALFVIFATREIWPFGDQMYLRSDEYHQYAPFLKEFQRILLEGRSLQYTWNIGLGSDIPSLYAYYLASPVNWLCALLSVNHIPEIMECFIIIKAGLMASLFAFYVQKHFKKRSFLAAGFGIFYAMSSYMAAYSWNLMWLDCLVLLPLIVLGLERLVAENRVTMYTIALAVSAFSNYYITIMIAFFLIMYFVYLLVCEGGKLTGFKNVMKKIWRFCLYSFIAAMMAAAAIVPAFVMLSSTASGNFSFPTTLRAYFNFLEMVAHAVSLVEPTVLSGYLPNIYCTVGLFMMLPLYWFCRKVDYRQKIGKSILMMIFLVSFSLNIPTYIWHGFHYPNSLSSRQSFIYIFLVLVMAYEVVNKLRSLDRRLIIICGVAASVAIFALQALYNSEDYTMIIAYVSVAYIILYTIWAVLACSGQAGKKFLIISFLLIVIIESSINTGVTGYSTTTRSVYFNDNRAITLLLESVKTDELFYRTEKAERRTKNDGAWLDYNSASEFSSTVQAYVEKFYDHFGMQASTNSYSYYGHTPLTAAMLDIRYVISADESDDRLLYAAAENDGYILYENKYVLPLGYMIDTDTEEKMLMNNGNPFIVQNSFVSEACGCDDIFTLSSTAGGTDVSFTVRKEGRQFIFIKNKLKKASVSVKRSGEIIYEKTFSKLENPMILDICDVEYGDLVTVWSEDDDVDRIDIYPAVMSYEKLDAAMQALGDEGLELTYFSDTEVKGTITAKEDGLMMTSIVYSDGWDVYVDGAPAQTGSFAGAFITVPLSAGTHDIRFVYHSPELLLSCLISAAGILLFVFLMLYRKYGKLPARRKPRHSPGGVDRECPGVSDEGAVPAVSSDTEASNAPAGISDAEDDETSAGISDTEDDETLADSPDTGNDEAPADISVTEDDETPENSPDTGADKSPADTSDTQDDDAETP